MIKNRPDHRPATLNNSYLWRLILLYPILLLLYFPASAQVKVYPVQDFNFGTFYQGNSGGTVEISANGTRTATGDIILMNTSFIDQQAIFDIEAPAGAVISFLSGPDAILTGSNGGSVTLRVVTTEPAAPFTTTAVSPARTRFKVSGKLTIGNRMSSPPGSYRGTFSITFNQE